MKKRSRAAKTQTKIRQDQIVRAALRLVAREGLGGLSLSALAKQVGLVPSGIYRHYPDKDAVIDAILAFIRARLLENVDAVRRRNPDPLRQLRNLLARHLDLIRRNGAIPLVVFSQDVIGGKSARRDLLQSAIRDYLDAVGGIIADGQKRGAIRRDVKPSELAVLFLGLVQPAAILHTSGGSHFDLKKHERAAWKFFSGALQARKGTAT